jgi:hypothetical protein
MDHGRRGCSTRRGQDTVDLEYTVAMSGRLGEEGVRALGTVAIVAGTVILVVTSGGPGDHVATYLVSALLVVGGCLLRIEAAVLRAGGAIDQGEEEPSKRPWHRDLDADQPEL